MGWFSNKNKEDIRRSAGKEPLTSERKSRNTSTNIYSTTASAGVTQTSTLASYIAPTVTTPASAVVSTTNGVVSNTENTHIVAQQTEYSQPYTDDDEEDPAAVTTMGTRSPVNDDDEMIEKNHGRDYGGEETDNDPSRSYSQADETEPEERVSYADVSKQNHLNSLFNGHLMKWKFEAEEGSGFIRIPACKCCLQCRIY